LWCEVGSLDRGFVRLVAGWCGELSSTFDGCVSMAAGSAGSLAKPYVVDIAGGPGPGIAPHRAAFLAKRVGERCERRRFELALCFFTACFDFLREPVLTRFERGCTIGLLETAGCLLAGGFRRMACFDGGRRPVQVAKLLREEPPMDRIWSVKHLCHFRLGEDHIFEFQLY
jgi:hypothetical protein